MRLALLLIAIPAFAAPQAPVRPSVIDVQAQLVHDRDVLTTQATAMCGGENVIDKYLLWEQELTLVRGRKGYEAYVAAVDNDQTIADQRRLIEDCNAMRLAKPWAASCEKRFAKATRAFAAAAPRTFPIYKSLDFRATKDPNPSTMIAQTRITPGRSWEFRAVFGPASLARTEFGVTDVPEQWTMVESEMGIIAARKYGAFVAVLRVETERWGDFEPAHHPLTTLYFEKLRAAADACIK